MTRIQPVGRQAEYEGWVTSVRGPTPLRAGDPCALQVQPTDHEWYNCRVRIACGDELLYGFADSGYMRCERGPGGAFVSGRDERHTRSDGDPEVAFDLRRRQMYVADEDPRLELYVSVVDRVPPPVEVPEPPAETRDAHPQTAPDRTE